MRFFQVRKHKKNGSRHISRWILVGGSFPSETKMGIVQNKQSTRLHHHHLEAKTKKKTLNNAKRSMVFVSRGEWIFLKFNTSHFYTFTPCWVAASSWSPSLFVVRLLWQVLSRRHMQHRLWRLYWQHHRHLRQQSPTRACWNETAMSQPIASPCV